LKIPLPIQVDHVVEIARTSALSERPGFLGKDLLIGIAARNDAVCRRVAVGMADGPLYRRLHQDLIGSQVELDPWQASATAEGAPVVDATLAVQALAWTSVCLKPHQVNGKLQTALFIHPVGYGSEGGAEILRIEVRLIGESEIQILGEAVGFEVALFQTGAALERPGRCERLLCIDTGEQPPQDIVFLDDVVRE